MCVLFWSCIAATRLVWTLVILNSSKTNVFTVHGRKGALEAPPKHTLEHVKSPGYMPLDPPHTIHIVRPHFLYLSSATPILNYECWHLLITISFFFFFSHDTKLPLAIKTCSKLKEYCRGNLECVWDLLLLNCPVKSLDPAQQFVLLQLLILHDTDFRGYALNRFILAAVAMNIYIDVFIFLTGTFWYR